MKITMVSTSDMGGAGVAARRLHLALSQAGVSSSFLTLLKLTGNTPSHQLLPAEPKGIIQTYSSRLRYHFPAFFKEKENKLANKPKGFEHFSLPQGNISLLKNELIQAADIVHLHWVADGMLDFNSFFRNIKKPVVWTLHDMNPFTGGCHHSDGCLAFMTGCSVCEQIKGIRDEALAQKNLMLKREALKNVRDNSLVIITPSDWLSQLSQKSALFSGFKHYVIPNIVNENIFKPLSNSELRRELGIEEKCKVILFVANDVSNRRKGISELIQAISNLSDSNVMVCTVGNKLDESALNIPIRQFGFVSSDEQMAKIYNVADLFVLPSHAENFPNTIVEALMCGTPVVASSVGGIVEQVNDKNGILFEKENVDELTYAIKMVLNDNSRFNRRAIHEEAKSLYSTNAIVEKHIALYTEILKS